MISEEYLIDLSCQIQELKEEIEAIRPLISDIKELLEAWKDPARIQAEAVQCYCDCKDCIVPGKEECKYYS